MRWKALLRGVVAIVLWAGALVALIAIDPGSGFVYAIGGTILTIALGALLDTLWLLLVPTVIGVLLIVPPYLASGDCFSCSDEGWNLATWIVILLFVVPATVALAAGIVGRRIARGRVRPD